MNFSPSNLPAVTVDSFPTVAYGLTGIVTAILVIKLAKPSKFDLIPAVGSSSWIGSWLTAIKFMTHATELIQEGYTKYHNTPFKIATPFDWQVIVTSREHVEEMARAPDDMLSFADAANKRPQLEYTMGHEIYHNRYHVRVVRSQLTRNIGNLHPEIRDEIIATFDDVLNLEGHGWKSVPALRFVEQVACRTSNRIFVGIPLCRHPDWIKLNIRYTIEVMKAGTIVSLAPKFLKPMVADWMTNGGTSRKLGAKLLRPIIEERRKCLNEYGKDWADKPNDFLSWCMDEAEGEATVENLTDRMLFANVAAMHTSSQSFTQTLFFLAAHPQYIKPLREEVEGIVEKEGWSKASVSKMRKVDSFLKECQRMEGLTASMPRIALKDFTFSDGTCIPKGSLISAAARAIQYDDEFYENASAFQPFRFADMRSDTGEGVKHQFVTTSADFLPFGHGKHACPGRFFAVAVLKTMLAHIVLNYDVKLEDETAGRPKSLRFMTAIIPYATTKVMFRKRVD